jgi:hypothetical protein
MPKKKKEKKLTPNEGDTSTNTEESLISGLIQPGKWDIEEELQGLDTFLEHNRDTE